MELNGNVNLWSRRHPEYEHNRCFLVLQLQTQRLCLLSKAAALLLDIKQKLHKILFYK